MDEKSQPNPKSDVMFKKKSLIIGLKNLVLKKVSSQKI